MCKCTPNLDVNKCDKCYQYTATPVDPCFTPNYCNDGCEEVIKEECITPKTNPVTLNVCTTDTPDLLTAFNNVNGTSGGYITELSGTTFPASAGTYTFQYQNFNPYITNLLTVVVDPCCTDSCPTPSEPFVQSIVATSDACGTSYQFLLQPIFACNQEVLDNPCDPINLSFTTDPFTIDFVYGQCVTTNTDVGCRDTSIAFDSNGTAAFTITTLTFADNAEYLNFKTLVQSNVGTSTYFTVNVFDTASCSVTTSFDSIQVFPDAEATGGIVWFDGTNQVFLNYTAATNPFSGTTYCDNCYGVLSTLYSNMVTITPNNTFTAASYQILSNTVDDPTTLGVETFSFSYDATCNGLPTTVNLDYRLSVTNATDPQNNWILEKNMGGTWTTIQQNTPLSC